MSAQDREPTIVREFRELYNYAYDVGRYVNLIYKRLDKIETLIEEVSNKFDERTTANRRDIAEILENMLTKSEFNEFVVALRTKVEEKLPSLPEISETPKETVQPSTISELPQLPQEEKRRRRIFS